MGLSGILLQPGFGGVSSEWGVLAGLIEAGWIEQQFNPL